MKIRLIAATLLGLGGAGLVTSTPVFANTANSGSTYGSDMNGGSGSFAGPSSQTRQYPDHSGQNAYNYNYNQYQNRNPGSAWMGSSGNGSSRNTGLRSHESGQQAQNYYHGSIGAGGNGSSRDTGMRSHESTGNGYR